MLLTTDNVPVSNVSSDIFMPKQSTKGIRRIVEESDEEKNRQIIEVCKLNELNGTPALPQYLLSIFECFFNTSNVAVGRVSLASRQHGTRS